MYTQLFSFCSRGLWGTESKSLLRSLLKFGHTLLNSTTIWSKPNCRTHKAIYTLVYEFFFLQVFRQEKSISTLPLQWLLFHHYPTPIGKCTHRVYTLCDYTFVIVHFIAMIILSSLYPPLVWWAYWQVNIMTEDKHTFRCKSVVQYTPNGLDVSPAESTNRWLQSETAQVLMKCTELETIPWAAPPPTSREKGSSSID